MMQAKDIMRENVVSASPKMTLREVRELFTGNRITGAPVVDARAKIVGVISQSDLVRNQRAEDLPSYHLHDDAMPGLSPGLTYVEPERLVEDVMNAAALSADEATPVEQLALVMLAKRIHRILITREGRICGIVTSLDMLRALLPAAPMRAAAPARRPRTPSRKSRRPASRSRRP
jgi:CBS domain-containing protein